MKDIKNIDDISMGFNAKEAKEYSDIQKRKHIDDVIIDIYNKAIIPTINKGDTQCSYNPKYSYLKDEIRNFFEQKGFTIVCFNINQISLTWYDV